VARKIDHVARVAPARPWTSRARRTALEPFTTVDEDLTDHIRSATASLPDAPVSRDLERPYAARESDTRPVLLEPLPAGLPLRTAMKEALLGGTLHADRSECCGPKSAPPSPWSTSARGLRGSLASPPSTITSPIPRSDGTTDLRIVAETFHAQFCADVPADQAARMAVAQRPATQEALVEPSGERSLWQHVPSWFVFGEEDRNIPAALEHFLADRAGARRTIEIPGASHALPVSQPDAVAALILDAAALRSAQVAS
jgi:pimeloyl-ACP methyl ester carboxylesterase